jgi:hypothetical protein
MLFFLLLLITLAGEPPPPRQWAKNSKSNKSNLQQGNDKRKYTIKQYNILTIFSLS